MSATSPAPTVGVIARRLGVPVHKVEYIIKARGIAPSLRAGNLRVFNEEAVTFIATELCCIRSQKAVANG